MNKLTANGEHDAFLDIIANLVGISIILIVIVGASAASGLNSAKQKLAESKQNQLDAIKVEVENRKNEATSLGLENAELHRKIKYEKLINSRLENNRHRLLIALSEHDVRLKEIRNQLEDEQLVSIDLNSKIANLRSEIKQVSFQAEALNHLQQSEKRIINHYPTPIAKTVFSDEVHFQMANNKIVQVPLEQLIKEMKQNWEFEAQKHSEDGVFWAEAGPIDGFKLHYSFEIRSKNRRKAYKFRMFELEEVSESLGEDVATALNSASRFQRTLSRFNPHKTTVSIWVYPNEFLQLFEIRDWLRKNGFKVACWPLEENCRISGGPNGFRTSVN